MNIYYFTNHIYRLIKYIKTTLIRTCEYILKSKIGKNPLIILTARFILWYYKCPSFLTNFAMWLPWKMYEMIDKGDYYEIN